MKYENFNKAVTIVQSIDKKSRTLEDLESPGVTVIINANEHNGRIMTIGAHKSYEHEYNPFAMEFIQRIKEDLHNEIKNLKTELAEL
jgi:prefoldin subunit 5